MRNLVYVLLFICTSSVVFGQTIPEKLERIKKTDTLNNFTQDSISISKGVQKSEKSLFSKLDPQDSKDKKPKIQDYLIISHLNDTTYVDTTLTIQKEYKFNYLRRDNFGLMPFSNMGQTYNSLTHDFERTRLMPDFGARARHFNYMEIEDINYYRVPTPLTELLFKTAFEQGQLADSFFTVNTSPQFNFSIAYKGLRSLGKYQHLLTSTGNFRLTTNYRTKNGRYNVRGHIVTQDLLNQENGGLQDSQVAFFETGIEEFRDRALLEVNYENAESILIGKRFHLEQSYKIVNKVDSLSHNKLSLGHIISFEDKFFEYNQTSPIDSLFGNSFVSTAIKDRVTLENFHNKIQLNYSNNIIGDIAFNMRHTNYNYGYNKVVVLDGNNITNRLQGDIYAVGGSYEKQYKGFRLRGEMGLNISGDFEGNFIKAQASFKLNDDIEAIASLNHNSSVPNYNFLLHQHNYVNYNWQTSFNNTETQQLQFQLKSEKIAHITATYSTINDYTYFKRDETVPISEDEIHPLKPFQNTGTINYLKVKLQKEIRVGKFALDNTIMYQSVEDAENTLNVPEIITRNTLYFSSHLFKKTLYLQTGVTLNYFTAYNMNAYDPVLAEFYVQNDQEFGNFPRLDFFLNAKVRQTRIFLKAEHFNSHLTGYNYFSAPNNPYRDFIVRFGIVWNFFL